MFGSANLWDDSPEHFEIAWVKMHSGNLSRIALPNIGLLVLIIWLIISLLINIIALLINMIDRNMVTV